MTQSYLVLSKSLWQTANSVVGYLKQNHGLSTVAVETEIDSQVPRPTLHGKAADKSIICVEVHEGSCFPASVERFVSRCKTAQLPVRLYVAYIEGGENADFPQQLRHARSNGIGVLSVKMTGEVTVVFEPLPLTLADVRRIDVKSFPSKYRDRLTRAQQTYLQGDPVKGCSNIHEVLEDVTRLFAKRLERKKKIASWLTKKPNLDKDGWYNIAKDIYDDPKFSSFLPNVQPAIWASLIAQTKPRNEGNHPPATTRARAERDRKLRTRFEEASDTLLEVIKAIAKAKL